MPCVVSSLLASCGASSSLMLCGAGSLVMTGEVMTAVFFVSGFFALGFVGAVFLLEDGLVDFGGSGSCVLGDAFFLGIAGGQHVLCFGEGLDMQDGVARV